MSERKKESRELRRERARKLGLLRKLNRILGARGPLKPPDMLFSLRFLRENFSGPECVFLLGPGGLLMEEEPGSGIFRISVPRGIIWATDIVGPGNLARILAKMRREGMIGDWEGEFASGF